MQAEEEMEEISHQARDDEEMLVLPPKHTNILPESVAFNEE